MNDTLARPWVLTVIGIFVLVLVLSVLGVPSRFSPDATPTPIPSAASSASPEASGSVEPSGSAEASAEPSGSVEASGSAEPAESAEPSASAEPSG